MAPWILGAAILLLSNLAHAQQEFSIHKYCGLVDAEKRLDYPYNWNCPELVNPADDEDIQDGDEIAAKNQLLEKAFQAMVAHFNSKAQVFCKTEATRKRFCEAGFVGETSAYTSEYEVDSDASINTLGLNISLAGGEDSGWPMVYMTYYSAKEGVVERAHTHVQIVKDSSGTISFDDIRNADL